MAAPTAAVPFKVTLAGALLDAAEELAGALEELTGVLDATTDDEEIADTDAALLEAGTSTTDEFAALELTAVLEGEIELTATLDGVLLLVSGVLLAGASLLAATEAARLLAATEATLLDEGVEFFLLSSPPHPTNNAANKIPARGLILTLISAFSFF